MLKIDNYVVNCKLMFFREIPEACNMGDYPPSWFQEKWFNPFLLYLFRACHPLGNTPLVSFPLLLSIHSFKHSVFFTTRGHTYEALSMQFEYKKV